MNRRVSAVMGAAAMVLFASAASAQAKPDFSGKWTQDAEKTAAANPAMQGGGGGGGGGNAGRGGAGGGRGMGGPMTIKLDAGALTIEREGQNGVMSTVYKLDGTEQTITQGQGEAKVKAKWEGSTIVVETARMMGENAITTKAVYTIEGDYLVISTTAPGRQGGEATTRKAYYKKG
jgi:hypothetical protein